MTKQTKIVALISVIISILILTLINNASGLKGQILSTSRESLTITREKKWLSEIPKKDTRERLNQALEQTLNSKETDELGNILKTINGEKRTVLGYQFQKALYLESIRTVTPWPELQDIKKLPIPKSFSSSLPDQKINLINNLTARPTKPDYKKKDSCFAEEKPNNLLDKIDPEDNICEKILFQNGAKDISLAMKNYFCTGVYKGIPVLQHPSSKYFVVPYVNTDGKVDTTTIWGQLCLNYYYKQVKENKNQKDWLDSGSGSPNPTTLKEVKKCIDSNDNSEYYNKWLDKTCFTSEICDNNIDDDQNGYTDCEDATCEYFTTINNLNQDAICLDKKREICGNNDNTNGTVKSIPYDATDFLCYENYQYKTWAECDTTGILYKKGDHGVIKKESEIVNSNGCNYICAKNGKAESWVGCGCNIGPNGVKAKEGELFSGYKCNQSQWVEENKYVDDLNEINPLFHKADYDPQGFMYWSADLYKKGTFPLLPNLTTIKDQGERGSCQSFSDTAAAEIVLLNRPDLSEQNLLYLMTGETAPQAVEDVSTLIKNGIKFKHLTSKVKFNIGYEKEWPYNPSKCTNGSYYSDLLNKSIPCSNKFHQGIPTSNPNAFEQYSYIKNTQNGSCVTAQNLDSNLATMTTEQKIAYLANIINVQHYPLAFGVNFGTGEDQGKEIGFSTESFWVNPNNINGNNPHGMLVVGFINKDDIPEPVKLHYHFKKNEHYFIIKNSYGTGFGDGGFLYAPASLFVNNSFSLDTFKYDKKQEVYPNCPNLKATMQIAN